MRVVLRMAFIILVAVVVPERLVLLVQAVVRVTVVGGCRVRLPGRRSITRVVAAAIVTHSRHLAVTAVVVQAVLRGRPVPAVAAVAARPEAAVL